jgi:hypothetical protein
MMTPEQKIYHKAWRDSHKEKKASYNAAYYASHKEAVLGRTTRYCASHKEASLANGLSYRSSLKLSAMNAYGGAKCACCGETLVEGLTIDHVNGDGAKHRQENGMISSSSIYLWLKKNGYPRGFQVLCGTCNLAKGTSDHCPHEDLRIAWG